MSRLLKNFFDFVAEEAAPILRDIVRQEIVSLREQFAKNGSEERIKQHVDEFGASSDPDEAGLIHGLKLAGGFLFRAYDRPSLIDRVFKRERPLWADWIPVPNMVVNAALNDVLSVYLNSGTQKTTWYLGLINNSGFSALAAADTASSHAGWTESTDYTQSVRQTWTPSAASGQSITNPTSATFTMNATVTIKGAFLISDSTKGGTTGTLFATGAFSSNQSLVSGQNLKVTYTCPATAT